MTLQQDLLNKYKQIISGAKQFVQQNPTPTGFLSKQIQPQIQQVQRVAQPIIKNVVNPVMQKIAKTPVSPLGVSFHNAPTYKAPLTNLTSKIPQQIKMGAPGLQLPEMANEMVNRYGRMLQGKGTLSDVGYSALDFLPVVGGLKAKASLSQVDDLSRVAKNSLLNIKTGIKEGGIQRAIKEIKSGKLPPVKIRTLEDGTKVLEDGRHHLEAARQLGLKNYPIEDVTSKYRNLDVTKGRLSDVKKLEEASRELGQAMNDTSKIDAVYQKYIGGKAKTFTAKMDAVRTEMVNTNNNLNQARYLAMNPNVQPSPISSGRLGDVSDLTSKVLKNEDAVRSVMNGGIFKMKLENGRTVAFGEKSMLYRLQGEMGDVTDIIPATVGRGKTGTAGSGQPRLILDSQDDLIKLKSALRGDSTKPQVWDHIPQGAKVSEDGKTFWYKEKQYPVPNVAQPPVPPSTGGEIGVVSQFSQRGTVPTQVAQSKLKILPQEQMPVVASNPQGASQATKLPSTSIAQETIEQESIKQASRIVRENKGSPLPDIISRQPITVSEKVGLFDYIRTPDRVLKKIGLGKESDLIRQKYDDYIRELPIEIEKITKWSKQVAPESNQRIFKYLDGQKIELTPQEMKVTNEIKGYLSQWADKLKLPKEKRISNYITHIFDKDLIKKEFDPELARLIENRVAGSVYDPFTEQRLGALGYKEDTWQALDAYVKRATRKVNMDVALEQVKAKAKGLEQSQYDYVKQYVDRINMRPTKLDNLLDNTIKQLVGYKFGMRPVAQLTRIGRQAVYRGTLGLNVGSSMRNLTQGANTYAKLGEKYTTIGYLKNLMKIATGDDELQRVGVLRDEFIQDRSLNATKKVWEKLDKGLFALFEFAEKINRGSAYFGAKAQALAKGMDEQQAIEYGKKIVRDTQFTFGSVDTPPILSSDIGKLLLQFQSYTLKQGEFLGEMIAKKDLAGMVRYSLAGLALTYTFGELFGMKPSDLIPSVRFGLPPTIQAPIEVGKAIIGTKDKWGNELDSKERLQNAGKALIPFIPGGVQIKKTIEGLGDTGRGYAQTASGNVKYPVAQTPSNKVRGALFGGYNLPEAQAYKKSNTSALSPKQSNMFKIAPDRNAYYQQILDNREKDNAIEKAKLEVENTHKSINIKDVQIYWDDEEEKVRTKTIKEKTIKETKVKKGKKAKKGKKPSFKIKTIRIPKLKLAKIKKIKIPRLKKQKNYTLKVPKIKKMKVTGRLA